MNYRIVKNDDYLSHHGILGQKWGKRNGPPYPLDAEDHSASEKKAGWRKSLDGSAKGYQKALNSYEREKTRLVFDNANYVAKARKAEHKAIKAGYRHGSNSKQVAKWVKKNNEAANKANEIKSLIDEGDKEVSKLLDEIGEKGYTVAAKTVYRSPYTGAEWAAMMAINIASAAFTGVAVTPADLVEGRKYKVFS